MENNEFKIVHIKNCSCYYYRTLIGLKPLWIRSNKIYGFIKIYDGSKYLVLVSPEKYNAIYNRNRYLISLKSSITYIFFHYFAKIKVDSYDSLPTEKRLTLNKATCS